MVSQPTVSICIPTYNAERFCRQTIQTVLDQTFTDWELLIVDNQSQDQTVSIARSFRDPRIKVFTGMGHVNVAKSWTRALKLATGTFIKLLCADDLLHPACLQEQVTVLRNHADVALVACRRDFVNSQGDLILSGRGLLGLSGKCDSSTMIRHVVRSGLNPIGEAGVLLFRREHFEQAGAFEIETRFAMDLQMWTRLLQHGNLYAQEQSLAGFRLNNASISATTRNQGYEHRRFLRQLAKESGAKSTDLWKGLSQTHIAGGKRKLLFWSANHRFGRVRRLPRIALRDKQEQPFAVPLSP